MAMHSRLVSKYPLSHFQPVPYVAWVGYPFSGTTTGSQLSPVSLKPCLHSHPLPYFMGAAFSGTTPTRSCAMPAVEIINSKNTGNALRIDVDSNLRTVIMWCSPCPSFEHGEERMPLFRWCGAVALSVSTLRRAWYLNYSQLLTENEIE